MAATFPPPRFGPRFGFRPITEHDLCDEYVSGESMDYVGVGGDEHPDRFDAGNDAVPGDTDTDEDLFIAETETLVDTTGFGAKQREINERTNGKFREATERRLPGPFLGSTLHELCESFACATESATPTNVWADVVLALRAREVSSTCNGAVLDPQTARHMKYRATLIEWILEVCADFGFGPTTADLAVQYMVRVFFFDKLAMLPIFPVAIGPGVRAPQDARARVTRCVSSTTRT